MDNLSASTLVDVAVASIVLASAFFAYFRGFVHEVLSVGGWVGAIFAAIYGLPYAKPYTRDMIDSELIADFSAGAGLFVLTLVVLSLLTRLISHRMRTSSLNELDRSLGFLFGIARGAIMICLLYIGAQWIIPPPEKTAEEQEAIDGEKTAGQNSVAPARDQGKSSLEQYQWLHEARAMPLIKAGAEILRTLIPSNEAEKANQAKDKVRETYEQQKILRDLLTPAPKDDTSERPGGYDRKERSDMERLIESNK